jgi:hypothetical protein
LVLRTFTYVFPATAVKTTVEEASSILDIVVPAPDYLPNNLKVQEVYLQDNIVRLLVSDRELEKKVLIPDNTDAPDQYAFECKIVVTIGWYSQGMPGGLKLPGERPEITPTKGLSVASVIEEKPTQNSLWWDWQPDPGESGMFEIVISAAKMVAKEELVKIAESIR